MQVSSRDIVVPYPNHGQLDLRGKRKLKNEAILAKLENDMIFFTFGVDFVLGHFGQVILHHNVLRDEIYLIVFDPASSHIEDFDRIQPHLFLPSPGALNSELQNSHQGTVWEMEELIQEPRYLLNSHAAPGVHHGLG